MRSAPVTPSGPAAVFLAGSCRFLLCRTCVLVETQVWGSAATSLSTGVGQPSVPAGVPSVALPSTKLWYSCRRSCSLQLELKTARNQHASMRWQQPHCNGIAQMLQAQPTPVAASHDRGAPSQHCRHLRPSGRLGRSQLRQRCSCSPAAHRRLCQSSSVASRSD
jgi:hypothetical protein